MELFFDMQSASRICSYVEIVSILRKAINDISAFDRHRKNRELKNIQQKPTAPKGSEQPKPWNNGAWGSNPSPLDTVFGRNSPGSSKTLFIKCEKDNCLLASCPEPLNLKKSFQSIKIQKKEKPEPENNSRWKAKGMNLSELQHDVQESFEVYETIVAESLISLHNYSGCEVGSAKVNTVTAFSKILQGDETDNLTRAFQVTVGNGDTYTADASFTSLLDMIPTLPSVQSSHHEGFNRGNIGQHLSHTRQLEMNYGKMRK